jgi:hypothetical protein
MVKTITKLEKKCLLFLVSLLFTSCLLNAQNSDTILNKKLPLFKNVIKFNPTPMLLYSNYNLTFSYERILDHKRSLSFSAGYFHIPIRFDTFANIIVATEDQSYGYNFSLEYRFYMLDRNISPIPDGLYIAPYLSHYGYRINNNNNFIDTSIKSNGKLEGNFYMTSLGVELGYQFVFKNRFTLDLVLFGPSISYYGGLLNLTGELSMEDIQDINEDFYNQLLEKYPLIGDFVIDKTYIEEGKLGKVALGYRYLIQIGYHF